MNILLVGERYSCNLGDAVICETVSGLIIDRFGDAVNVEFCDISGKIDYEKNYQYESTRFTRMVGRVENRLPFLLKNNPLYIEYKRDEIRYLRTILLFNDIISKKKFDLILFAGGSMFMDYFAGLIYCIVRKASLCKIPVVFHACGISGLSDNAAKLLKKVFETKCVKSISIRDSKERFKSLFGNEIDVCKTYDTALCCKLFYKGSCEKIAKYGIGLIGLSQYYDLQKKMVQKLLKSDVTWKIFTNGAPNDQRMAERILLDNGIKKEDFSRFLCERPRTAKELVEVVTSFESIFSFRLHSQIIARSFGIDSYGIVWDDKIVDFYDGLGLSENYIYGTDTMNRLEIVLNREKKDVICHNVEKCANDSKENLLESIERVAVL